MYFTLLFETNHGPTLIYELCFHPCPVWFPGGSNGQLEDAVCIPPHRGPHFMEGDFRLLLEHAGIDREATDDNQQNPRSRKIGIVCHNSGHGVEDDLNMMMAEMKAEGFVPKSMFSN